MAHLPSGIQYMAGRGNDDLSSIEQLLIKVQQFELIVN